MRRHPDVIALTLLVIALAWFSRRPQPLASSPITHTSFRLPVAVEVTPSECPSVRLKEVIATLVQ